MKDSKDSKREGGFEVPSSLTSSDVDIPNVDLISCDRRNG